MSKIIKFNDNYPKLHGVTEATLVGIEQCKISEIPEALLLYEITMSDGKQYLFKLNQDSKVLILLFVSNDILFSTIRKANEDNIHYFNEIGQNFKIKIERA